MLSLNERAGLKFLSAAYRRWASAGSATARRSGRRKIAGLDGADLKKPAHTLRRERLSGCKDAESPANDEISGPKTDLFPRNAFCRLCNDTSPKSRNSEAKKSGKKRHASRLGLPEVPGALPNEGGGR